MRLAAPDRSPARNGYERVRRPIACASHPVMAPVAVPTPVPASTPSAGTAPIAQPTAVPMRIGTPPAIAPMPAAAPRDDAARPASAPNTAEISVPNNHPFAASTDDMLEPAPSARLTSVPRTVQ